MSRLNYELIALGVAATAGYLTAAHHAATHDPLTGIRNRAGLAAVADTVITAGNPAVVALVDLVGFKKVNDTHGHDAGDHILTVTADRLTQIAGRDGIAARLGGDEFALITTAPAADASDWLTGIHHRLTEPVTYHGATLPVGATVGAVLATPAHPAPLWLHRADLAMYDARATRRTTAIHTDFTDTPAPAIAARPDPRARDLARPTSHLTAAPTTWRAA